MTKEIEALHSNVYRYLFWKIHTKLQMSIHSEEITYMHYELIKGSTSGEGIHSTL